MEGREQEGCVLVGLMWKERGEAVKLVALTVGLVSSHRLQVCFPQSLFLTIFPWAAVTSFGVSHVSFMPPFPLLPPHPLTYIFFYQLFAPKESANRPLL